MSVGTSQNITPLINTGEDMHAETKERKDAMKERWKSQTFKVCTPSNPLITIRQFDKARTKSRVGTYLALDLEYLFNVKSSSGCNCSSLVEEMNTGGPKWCREKENKKRIIDSMMENKDVLIVVLKTDYPDWKSSINKLGSFSNSKLGTILLRRGCGFLLWRAIRKDEKTKNKPKGVVNPDNRKQKRDKLAEALSKTPEPKPFQSDIVFNLVWHFYPVKNHWKWHVERLKEILPKINGQIIIGVVTNKETDSLEDVKREFSDDRIHYIHNANHRLGELLTCVPAFRMLDTSVDSITLYGHSKGVQNHTKNSEAVRLWTETMYETVTFNMEETVQKLSEGYSCLGSFRTFGNHPLKTKHGWHYSGTFYNFRTQEVISDDFRIQRKYGGVEAFIGDRVEAYKSWNVIVDNPDMAAQYEISNFDSICAEQLVWESKRFGPVKMEQHKREFEWLKSRLKYINSMLVIGSRHGGLEYYLSDVVSEIVSVDPDPIKPNYAPELIIGSSHDQGTQDYIRSVYTSFNAVFIDGDHTAEGVLQDWEFAKSLSPCRIYFHDFINAHYHRRTGCQVHEVMPKILEECKSNNWSVNQKSVGCGWGGILEVQL